MMSMGNERNRVAAVNLSADNLDLRGLSSSSQRNSMSDDSDISESLSFGSMDLAGQNLDFSMVDSDSLASSSISQSSVSTTL